MKTIKVIDLLNKIASGEEVPKKIRYRYHFYTYDKEENTYIRKDEYESDVSIGEDFIIDRCLDDEIEIIEEDKKIGKWVDEQIDFINICREPDLRIYIKMIMRTQNQIIDVLNKRG